MSSSYVSTYMICIIMLSPYSTSQNELFAVIPIPLTPDNSSKHSCWLWIHDVSFALQGYPTLFIVYVCIDHRLQSSHAVVWIYRSKVTSNKNICCSCASFVLYVHNNNTPPYQSIPSWHKYTTHIIFCILVNVCAYEPVHHMLVHVEEAHQ